jgi:hypothetical protein
MPRNRNHIVGQKPPLKPHEVWSIRARLQVSRDKGLGTFRSRHRQQLRGCDLVAITVGDIAISGTVRDRAVIIQRKTRRPVQFEITEPTRAAVGGWIARRHFTESDYLLPSRVRGFLHRTGPEAICHAFDEAHEGFADLQEDWQHPSRAVALGANQA